MQVRPGNTRNTVNRMCAMTNRSTVALRRPVRHGSPRVTRSCGENLLRQFRYAGS